MFVTEAQVSLVYAMLLMRAVFLFCLCMYVIYLTEANLQKWVLLLF